MALTDTGRTLCVCGRSGGETAVGRARAMSRPRPKILPCARTACPHSPRATSPGQIGIRAGWRPAGDGAACAASPCAQRPQSHAGGAQAWQKAADHAHDDGEEHRLRRDLRRQMKTKRELRNDAKFIVETVKSCRNEAQLQAPRGRPAMRAGPIRAGTPREMDARRNRERSVPISADSVRDGRVHGGWLRQ